MAARDPWNGSRGPPPQLHLIQGPNLSKEWGPPHRPDDSQWPGAEVKSFCRLASLLDAPLIQATQNVVPVAETAGDKIELLRQWASGRCLSADRAGVYARSEVGGGRGRRVMRESGVN